MKIKKQGKITKIEFREALCESWIIIPQIVKL
jgi:hypothetical protein